MNCRAILICIHLIMMIDLITSDLIKPDKLEVNIGQLKIHVRHPKDDNTVYVIDNDSHEDEDDELSKDNYFGSDQDVSNHWQEAEKNSKKWKEKGFGWDDKNWKGKSMGFHNTNWSNRGDDLMDKISEEKKIYNIEDYQESTVSWKAKTWLDKRKGFSTNDKSLEIRQKPQIDEGNVMNSSRSSINANMKYEVKETLKNEFEERVYPATLFACSEEENKGLNTSQMANQFHQLFLRLSDYFKGVSLKLRQPVFSILHLNTGYVTDKLAMCFWITQEDEKTVADPDPGAEVFLWRMDSTCFFVRRFSGPGGDAQGEIWEKEIRKLNKGLEDEGLSPITDKHLLLLATYDAPWITEGRRDEVLMRKTDEGEGQWRGPWKVMVDRK